MADLTKAELNLLFRVHTPGFTTIKSTYNGTRIVQRTDSKLAKRCRELAKKGFLHRPGSRWELTEAGIKACAASMVTDAEKWVENKKKEGWTRQDFAKELVKLMQGEEP